MTDEAQQDQQDQQETTDKPFDYDQKYAVDANSGLAPQPGGAVLPTEPEKELLVDSEGEIKAVEGDVTSTAHQAKIDTEGKSQEETDKAVAATEGATDKAIDDQQQGGDDATATAGAYDPSSKSVADVKAYVKAHPEEKDAVLAAEKAGQNRPTLVNL